MTRRVDSNSCADLGGTVAGCNTPQAGHRYEVEMVRHGSLFQEYATKASLNVASGMDDVSAFLAGSHRQLAWEPADEKPAGKAVRPAALSATQCLPLICSSAAVADASVGY